MKVIDVPIEKIQLGDRYRRDPGDIDALAANIREMGLLHPIGVDRYYHLLYGQRRLDACESLGWKKIPCVVINLKSVILGEYAENEFRKQFTRSERLAIGEAVEAEMGNRRGQRGQRTKRIKEKFPELKPGEQTRDHAAKVAGFGNPRTYEQAKRVKRKGSAALIAAMDQGEVTVAAAAKIASQPPEEQARILEMPKEEQKEALRQIRETKADEEANQARARDIRLYMGIYQAVKFIGEFYEEPKETWAGLWRVSAYDFADHLPKALEYLLRLKKEHPNEGKRPEKVS